MAEPIKSPIPGIAQMLMGAIGSGKTSSLRKWVDQGIQVMGIFTEPSWEVIADVPCPKLHYVYHQPINVDFKDMIDAADKINKYDLETISKLEGINKSKFRDFIDLLTCLSNFTCARCGEKFGSMDTWGTDKVCFVDSLSGINIMAMNLVIGNKPVKSVSNWGVAMDTEERLVQKLCIDRRCHLVLTTHIDRELDEVTGASIATASALGRKLAPKLGRFFTDVLLARQVAGKFEWSSTANGFDLKPRNCPFSDHLPADIGPLLSEWKKRGGVIEGHIETQR